MEDCMKKIIFLLFFSHSLHCFSLSGIKEWTRRTFMPTKQELINDVNKNHQEATEEAVRECNSSMKDVEQLIRCIPSDSYHEEGDKKPSANTLAIIKQECSLLSVDFERLYIAEHEESSAGCTSLRINPNEYKLNYIIRHELAHIANRHYQKTGAIDLLSAKKTKWIALKEFLGLGGFNKFNRSCELQADMISATKDVTLAKDCLANATRLFLKDNAVRPLIATACLVLLKVMYRPDLAFSNIFLTATLPLLLINTIIESFTRRDHINNSMRVYYALKAYFTMRREAKKTKLFSSPRETFDTPMHTVQPIKIVQPKALNVRLSSTIKYLQERPIA